MLSASGNPFKCHEEVLYLQPLTPPKRLFDIFSPLTGGCSEGLGAFYYYWCIHICPFLPTTSKTLSNIRHAAPSFTNLDLNFFNVAGRPGSSEVPRNPLTRCDVSSIPANGIFLTKKLKNKNKNAQRVQDD